MVVLVLEIKEDIFAFSFSLSESSLEFNISEVLTPPKAANFVASGVFFLIKFSEQLIHHCSTRTLSSTSIILGCWRNF